MTERLLAERIRAYYDETWGDYRWLWLSPRNYAIHFGYWDATTRTHAQSLREMNRALADRIGIQPGQRVLDAGCGVGGSALWLARKRGVEVVGVTLVASQVERARRFAEEAGLAGASPSRRRTTPAHLFLLARSTLSGRWRVSVTRRRSASSRARRSGCSGLVGGSAWSSTCV
jgi:cyclopropane fatty-acyl-phospholipid synthase-like methyltransferase